MTACSDHHEGQDKAKVCAGHEVRIAFSAAQRINPNEFRQGKRLITYRLYACFMLKAIIICERMRRSSSGTCVAKGTG